MKTPKNFILQLGSLIALYVSVTSILILIFSVTNLKFPDAAAYYWEDSGAREAVRTSIAMLVVFFPTFLIFTRLSNQDRRKFSGGEYGTLAKWLVYLSILGGILVLLGDLVTLINYFLNGEVTSRFLIKVFALLIVIGMTLHYYILDVRGFFKKNAQKAMYFGMGAIALVLASLSYGYAYIETPSEIREIRIDEKQVSDLRDMYWNVEEAYRATQALPENIDALYINRKKPTSPEGRADYAYNVLDEKTFELCAEFVAESQQFEQSDVQQPKTVSPDVGQLWYQNDNWEHGIGETCFKRTVRTIKEPVFIE